ncbi:MAG: GNAT family N-acetyltransferase [Planctomycetota bacterium]
MDFVLTERAPTVAEYQSLIASVGWKRRDPEAIAASLKQSFVSVCAASAEALVGMGRVISDGGLHYYITDVVVRPDWHRQGIGTSIVNQLNERLDRLQYANTFVGVVATPGSQPFYENLGYKAQNSDGPAMFRWLNATT